MTPLFVLFSIISASLSFLYYRETNPPISKSLKIFLGTLRALFIFIILSLIAMPILHFINKKQIPPQTIIAQDVSASMMQPLSKNIAKRKIAESISSKLQTVLSKTKAQYKIEKFSRGLTHDSLTTDIFLALRQIQKKYKDQNLSRIILLSDGLNHNNNNYKIIDEQNTPVFPVILGAEGDYIDISVDDIKTNNPVYLNSETEIGVSIGGLDHPVSIQISLKDDKDLILKEKYDPTQENNYFILNYTPTSLGYKKLNLRVELVDSVETNLKNNSRNFLLNVVKDRVKITMISSQPNWDTAFIHRILDSNTKFEVDLLVKRKGGSYFHNNSEIDPAEFLQQSDVLVLNNSSSLEFSNKTISQIERFVKMGGNLLYINKIDDDLEKLLPLVKSKFEQTKKANLTLTRNADNYNTFSIKKSSEENNNFWRDLPPITTHFYTKKGKAEIIAQADLATKNPVIAFSSYFKGHVLMFAGNGFYRWKMCEDSDSAWFGNFINSITEWLVNSNVNKRFVCTTSNMQYLEGEEVDFRCLIFDERMNLIPSADISLTINKDNNIIDQIYFEEDEHKYSAEIPNLKVGKYQYQAECKIGNNLNDASGEFIIEPMSLENSSTGLNTNMLSFIATQSGGALLEGEDNFENISWEENEYMDIQSATDFELWKKWYIPFMAILFFSIELLIRKRKGLL